MNGLIWLTRLFEILKKNSIESRALDLVIRIFIMFFLVLFLVVMGVFVNFIGVIGVLSCILLGIAWWARDLYMDYRDDKAYLKRLQEEDKKDQNGQSEEG